MFRTTLARLLAVPALVLLCASISQAQAQTQASVAQAPAVVQTDQGAVVGRQAAVKTYFGIPYAAPPVGKLRWQPPQAAPTWTAPRQADAPGPVCPQVVLALFPVPGQAPGSVQGNEDCLFLNVYTPSTASAGSKLPVLVWIHGGAFTVGSGNDYDGSVWAEKYGLVVVTLNYRLGALGFLALPSLSAEVPGGTSGNYGFQDQQAALKWVGRNIGAFGGDPAAVTIAGESAGGMSVCTHLASPLSAGLFKKAIIQSGLCSSPGNAVSVTDAATRNLKYVGKLGCRAEDLACLRRTDVPALLKTTVPGLRPVSNLVWSPVHGTAALPLPVRQAVESGQINRVPVMAGTNHDEGRLFVSVASPSGKPVSVIQYWGGTGLLVGAAKSGRVLAQYPYRRYQTPALAFATMFTDGVFSCTAQRLNAGLSKLVPVYAFEFNDPQAVTTMKSPADLPGFGSFHGSSLVYAFQTPIVGGASPDLFSPAQARLSDAFSRAWANFTKTGTPTLGSVGAGNDDTAGVSPWQRFDPARNNVQAFTPAGVQQITSYSADHKCDFWTGLDVN